MRDFLKKTGRLASIGWFWPLVLLALPNCSLYDGGLDNPNAFDAGPEPRTSAVICAIPKVPDTNPQFPCATPTDIGIGMPSTEGAVALNLGNSNTIMLDYSPESYLQCGDGHPRRIDLFDPFPTGTVVCLNCEKQMPNPFPAPKDVCVQKCREMVSVSGALFGDDVKTFCEANAKVATNYDKNVCIDDVCLTTGQPLSPFPDPRLKPEDLIWVDPVNTSPAGNTITFQGPGNGGFSAGAASDQIITGGDFFVEFEAGEPGVTHVIGVRTSSCDKAANCPDNDETLGDIPLSINLNSDGKTNVVENGAVVFSDTPYQMGEKFRIYVVDRHDGTADITYKRYTGTCTPGALCNDSQIYERPKGTGPSYPLRVDATFREGPASLKNVTIMRLK